MDLGHDAAGVSDGCTGVPFFHDLWAGAYECCVEHDLGGSDGVLLDCWQAADVPLAFAAFAILVMIILRPVYHWLRDRGWWPIR